MDIYELQKTEHENILHLLKQVSQAKDEEIANAFNCFRMELSAHKIAEEQTFFKLMQEKNPNLSEHIDIIKREHIQLEELFNQLRRSAYAEDLKAGLNKLNAVLITDIAEEEQLLAIAKTLLSPEEAERAAKEMADCKTEFHQRLNDRLNT